MAYTLVRPEKKQDWVGESSDTKPTEAPVGSTLFESDTGQRFVMCSTGWCEDLTIFTAFVQALREV